MSLTKRVLQRYHQLKSTRGTWESHWQEIADLTFPNHPQFVGDETRGTKKGLKMYDSTTAHASELLAAGLNGLLTNPASEWFNLKLTDSEANQQRDVKEWLYAVKRIMNDAINAPEAAFSTHIHEMYLGYEVFGTGLLFIGETLNRQGLMFKSVPLSEAYIAENSEGTVDTVFRTINTMTVANLVERWGLDKVSEGTKKKFQDEKFDQVIEVVHAVQPMFLTEETGVDMKYSSIFVETGEKHILSVSGYEEFPYAVPRFYKTAGEVYGRGPGVTSLPDNKLLNEMMRVTIKASQLVISPPLQAPDKGFLNPVRTIPGGINYFKAGSKDRIEPLFTGANIPISVELMNEIRQRIRSIFFIDQLMLIRGPEMTATEVLQRTEETMRLLGPVLGRMQSEALGPIIDRVFSVLSRQGRLPEAPSRVQGQQIEIEYTSPIAKAQKQLEAGSLQRVFELATPLLSIDPVLAKKFDGSKIIDGLFDMFGVRPDFLLEEEEFQSVQQQQSEAEAQAQQAEINKTNSEAGLNVANVQQALQ